MLRTLHYAALTVALALALTAVTARAADPEVRFWVIAGGGEVSTAGSLQVSGTAGQIATSSSTGGVLSVRGGFWRGVRQAASGVDDGAPPSALVTRLAAPYPNPFNPATRIGFELAARGPVRVRIHDARGLMVRELVAGDFLAGRHETMWDGKDERGGRVPSGVYFVRFEAGGKVGTEKMTLLK